MFYKDHVILAKSDKTADLKYFCLCLMTKAVYTKYLLLTQNNFTKKSYLRIWLKMENVSRESPTFSSFQ